MRNIALIVQLYYMLIAVVVVVVDENEWTEQVSDIITQFNTNVGNMVIILKIQLQTDFKNSTNWETDPIRLLLYNKK